MNECVSALRACGTIRYSADAPYDAVRTLADHIEDLVVGAHHEVVGRHTVVHLCHSEKRFEERCAYSVKRTKMVVRREGVDRADRARDHGGTDIVSPGPLIVRRPCPSRRGSRFSTSRLGKDKSPSRVIAPKN